jgi:hypothetical protein
MCIVLGLDQDTPHLESLFKLGLYILTSDIGTDSDYVHSYYRSG